MFDSAMIPVLAGIAAILVFATLAFFASRYKRCPSDRILVVYGKVGGNKSARCVHGGASFVWPVIQDYAYLSLTPMPIDIQLRGALSQQNIRVNTPSTFTVGISTEPGVMENAAERLLGQTQPQIQELAKDIIFGQMRVVIATMPIEEINADRDKLIANISNGVEVELKKVGLRLINVNVQDITDESGYIEALGKEAAARAINDAKIKVSQQERDGDIGAALADKEKRISVAQAQAEAVTGENLSAVEIANSIASRREKEAEAERLGTAAEKVASAKALQESYLAEESAERQRAKREEAAMMATIIVQADIEKRKIEVLAEAEKNRVRISAEAQKQRIELEAEAEKRRIELVAQAEAERIRIIKEGEAAGLKTYMEAEAAGTLAQLEARAKGFQSIVTAAGGADKAAQLMVTEQLPGLVAEQVKAISGIKIDKLTVWDSGRTGEDGKTRTADFVSGLVGAIPPLHDIARNAGIELPGYLGKPASSSGGKKPAPPSDTQAI
ncbi:SPFH domain-containing protein [Prosthecobacter sp.]|uniref:flotillin family protein n=1 Tax=Prosthecobacter sp. TaxID=1965333 RepID=UPI002AB84138|nr:SPFH domain-containing protein [Prosthecobacter sp.]MDZ4402168.1 SPFH domain-containing protein [Prosthecobacter sp.]